MRPIALLIHSGGFTSRQWRKLGQRLAATHDVLAPDLIGYGSEPWPPGVPFHYRQDVDRLIGMLDTPNPAEPGAIGRPADVVGHSYGALLALHIALLRPDLVRSIAVYEPVAFGVLGPEDAEVRALLALPPYHADAAGARRRGQCGHRRAPRTHGLSASSAATSRSASARERRRRSGRTCRRGWAMGRPRGRAP